MGVRGKNELWQSNLQDTLDAEKREHEYKLAACFTVAKLAVEQKDMTALVHVIELAHPHVLISNNMEKLILQREENIKKNVLPKIT